MKKKSDMNRWVMHVPVSSTSHIKQKRSTTEALSFRFSA